MHSYVIFAVLFLTAGFVGFKIGRIKPKPLSPTPHQRALCSQRMYDKRRGISEHFQDGWRLGIEHERRG